MKNFSLLFVVCVCCVAGANGQVAGALNSQVQVITMPYHTEHASQTGLATGQNLLERSGGSYAKGERPLWEVYELAPEAPLGDAAREARKEHATAKKATKIWHN